MGNPHILVLPFPAQGHVNPFMNLSKMLAKHGFQITFVNTDFNHKRVVRAMNEEGADPVGYSALKLVSIPDGLGSEDERNDPAKFLSAISSTVLAELEKLIEDINGSDIITCLLADVNMALALEVAHKMGIKGAILCPSSAATFALALHMPKLIEEGIIDCDGLQIMKGGFELSPEMPTMRITDIYWCSIDDLTTQKIIYHYNERNVQNLRLTEWWLCNTTFELEPGALSLYPKILAIGPLVNNYETRSLGQFWEEDLSCLSWLDQQPPCSVIYVAFGSITIFDPKQFKELALGLDLTSRPFLWVVRTDANGSNTKIEYPDEFKGNHGKIVQWVPQQKVLGHPAIACFISHCGWNSTMEGLCNGVPFLCWPYFADQFYDKTYICDALKVGLGFDLDEKGLILCEEIKKKVNQLLGDENIRARSIKLKKMIMENIKEDGRSFENFRKFMEWLKE